MSIFEIGQSEIGDEDEFGGDVGTPATAAPAIVVALVAVPGPMVLGHTVVAPLSVSAAAIIPSPTIVFHVTVEPAPVAAVGSVSGNFPNLNRLVPPLRAPLISAPSSRAVLTSDGKTSVLIDEQSPSRLLVYAAG